MAQATKLAIVIDVGHGPAAQDQAMRTQRLLLDGCGARLDSIRLAAPRLLPHACRAALAEEPGVLVIVGGPRASRIAGQLAYERGIPILFLPGFRPPIWARHLWGTLSPDDMISALARGDVKPVRLGASTAGGQIFFDSARCGLLPLAGELRRDLAQADIFSEVWRGILRGMRLSRLVMRPRFRFRCEDTLARSATALVVSAAEQKEEARPASFVCEAWKHSALEHLGAFVGSSFGGDWRRSGRVARFACTQLTIDQKRSFWLLLDGVPHRFDGPVKLNFIPDAIQTFAFSARRAANDSASRSPRSARGQVSEGTFGRAVTFPNPRPAVAR